MKKSKKILAPVVALGMVVGATSFSAHSTVSVEPGDTLWGIAQKHDDLSVNQLIELNSELDPQAIPVGTEINLEANKTNVVTHTVQQGNTLNEIADTYDGVSLADLYALNEGIDPYDLTIGSEVIVVDNNNNSTVADVVFHTVQPGNTYYNISSVYDGVTVDDLIKANPNEDMYSLTIGSKIAIPLE